MVHSDLINPRTVTFDHVHYRLRPLHSGDELRLQAFFYSHSRETVHLRYGYIFTSMSRARAHRLVDVHDRRGLALGIFSTDHGEEVLHAIGRYCVETKHRAEVAFVVRESKRRCGMATALLRKLGQGAEAHGIQVFSAHVLRENDAMCRLFARYHPTVKEDPDGGQLEYLFNVRQLNQFPDPTV